MSAAMRLVATGILWLLTAEEAARGMLELCYGHYALARGAFVVVCILMMAVKLVRAR